MEIHTLHDLFVHELRGAYHMERRLVDVLDDVAANAENARVEAAFAQHRDETVEHVAHVEAAFRALGREPAAREYPVVEALDEERRTAEAAVADPVVLDLYYLYAGTRIERLELSTYEALLEAAERLELGHGVTDPLREVRDSEKETFDQLRLLATASELKRLWHRLRP